MSAYSLNQYQTYQNKSVFVTSGDYSTDQTVSGSLRQIARIQSVDWNIPYPVVQTTYLDAGYEAYMSSHNPVDVNISWLHTNGRAEQYLGLVDTVGPNGALTLNLSQEKNLYIAIQNIAGVDSIGMPTGVSQSIIGMGQALMTSYNINGQVGGLIQSRATMNCLTAFNYTGSLNNAVPAVDYRLGDQLTGLFNIPAASSQYNPSATGYVDPIAASAVSATDMFLIFPEGSPFGVVFTGDGSCYLQSFDLTLAFDRQELKPLGYVYPPVRALHYPIRVDLDTEAIVSQYQKDALTRVDCLASNQTVALLVKQPCSTDVLFWFLLENLQIESQSFSSSIGPTDTVRIRGHGLISNPNSVVCSPAVRQLINVDTNSGWGSQW